MTDRPGRRISLSVKLYILIVVIILGVSLATLLNGYHTYSTLVEESYFKLAQQAVKAASAYPDSYLGNLVPRILSDDFRQTRERAIAENDEGIIESWLREQPGIMYEYYVEENRLTPETAEFASLYGDYCLLNDFFEQYAKDFGMADLYIQYMENGVIYNIVDPGENLFHVGSIEETAAEFEGYGDNEYVPPTVYRSQHGWVCKACEPVLSTDDGSVLGLACVDIDMNEVMAEQGSFLVKSMFFVLGEIAVAIVISMVLMRHHVTRPLNRLVKAAKNFARDDENLTGKNVIQLPIRSNDEIGDLYHEIQSMQNRIVDYTENITRITAERERTHTEMSLAAEIQASMLPRVFPPYPDRKEFDLFASMDPAREVGGDFYDFFFVDDDHLCLVMADVSGKGVPSALFMMASKIIISDNVKMGKSPARVLYDTNMALCANGQVDMFVTVWIGILEISTGKLTAADGGHEYPAILTDSGFKLYQENHGFVVGGIEGMNYVDYEIRMKPGDKLFIYTDGVPEAQNSARKMFGLDRMTETLNDSKDGTPEEILKNMRRTVDEYVGDAKQFDDLTMLCLEYKGTLREGETV